MWISLKVYLYAKKLLAGQIVLRSTSWKSIILKKSIIALTAITLFCFGITQPANASGTEAVTKKVTKEATNSALDQATSQVADNAKDQAIGIAKDQANKAVDSAASKATEALTEKTAGTATDVAKAASS